MVFIILFITFAFKLVPEESSSTVVPVVTFFLNTLQFIVIKTFMYFANIVGTTNLFFIQVVLQEKLFFSFKTNLFSGWYEYILPVWSSSLDT